MAGAEWLRTFVAIYRAGSVSEGARRRGLSQPAASQQLAALERAEGTPLFVRVPGGVSPSGRGAELYGEVAEALDRLEGVLTGLDAGRRQQDVGPSSVRIGTSADVFCLALLPRLTRLDAVVTARFGGDAELTAALAAGEVDVAVTAAGPARRGVDATAAGARRYVLVGPVAGPRPPDHVDRAELGAWLVERPWVAYSVELPATRRYWQRVLGRTFAGSLRLVAPDLRTVVRAVELGVGFSLLPAFACVDALAGGRVVALRAPDPVEPAEPWVVSTRSGEVRAEVLDAAACVVKALGGSGTGGEEIDVATVSSVADGAGPRPSA